MLILVQLWGSEAETGISPGSQPSNILWPGKNTHARARTHNSRQDKLTEKCIKGDFKEIKDLVPIKRSKTKAFKVHFKTQVTFVLTFERAHVDKTYAD